MRIKVTFVSSYEDAQVMLNYNYTLSSMIYGITGSSSIDYCVYLNTKSNDPRGRRFKLFTFSNLLFSNYRVEQRYIRFGRCTIDWFVSSPVARFKENLLSGIEGRRFINIGGVKLDVQKVETIQAPVFSGEMKFTCISPITVTAGKCPKWKSPHYIRYDEDGFSEAVRKNLIKKYVVIHGKQPDDDRFEFEFDSEYIARRCGKIQKKIRFMNTDIVGFMAPFSVKGNPNLIEVGYHCGFGEKGSMGFGMAKPI
ncbi:MAG: CRISPR-associated endoribonuclease Cas6 [Nitrospirae bacterium]|nr:CRISPR-associated endoribonuclease Cas6 [Nitrospirota bacterium]